ncbi:clathrin light chain-like isoform X1 [Daphnia pulex]|uniref:clathrin light chain-like isoform X1 n=1 Tax=Daphnia pulex TaxID=6669 RepID=UPI001EE0E6E3|nr:clathrin light chain-like isoform X1 [Daphnia pulex]XP_046638474.1 clathrin light chain-like isoform X1 [Daphnia pulicaria]
MDAFGDDFTGVSEVADVDPAAEFLAREHDQLAGLEDLIPEVSQPEHVETIQDDFMTENAFEVQASEAAVNYELDAFSEVEVDNGLSNQLSGMGLKENGYSAPQMMSSIPREEPEKIRKWREEQKLRLEKKDEEEERKKQEMKEAARKELEDWYKHHKETIEKTRSANREAAITAEKELIGTPTELEPGQEWERIAKLCDFNPKASRNSKDVSRMRSIILQLKQNPSVAAAGH